MAMHLVSRILKTCSREAGAFGRCRRGIASLEFAMILPLMAVLLFGTIDVGRLLTDYQLVSKSVRDATRFLARTDATALGLDKTACTINNTSMPVTEAKNLALTGMIDGDPNTDALLGYWTDPTSITVTPTCWDNSGGTYSGFYAGVDNIPIITMQATVSFPFLNGWILDRGATLTFDLSHQEIFVGE